MSDGAPYELESSPVIPPRARDWKWWLRAAEVRLRFVLLVLAILVVTTQWSRLRTAWDDAWQAMWSQSRNAAVSSDMEYFCPMDPGVVSVWPAVCPICNMDLVQRQKHDAQLLPEGVIARMQLSPYRIQLAGIRTAEVQPRELVDEIPITGTIEIPAAETQPAETNAGKPTAEIVLSATVSRLDRAVLDQPCKAFLHAIASYHEPVEVVLHPMGESSTSQVAFRVEPASELPSWFTTKASVRGTIHIPIVAKPENAATAEQGAHPLAIPESALVDHGARQLVFIESMPGMFDAREVTLGRRCGDWYPVLSGLNPGERIAETGAFLIDAETRLNPSLAVAYFGANQANSASRAPQVKVAGTASGPPALSAEDAALAKEQSICPITDLDLDSMGGPVLVTVEGQKVFLCCKGCEGKLKSNPRKYLAKLPPHD